MEVDPPYLLARGEDGHPGVSLSREAVTGVIEVTVSGRWNRRLCLDVYTVLRKCMAEIPSAIIIELRNLRDLDGESASMWLAVARAASTLQPPAQLALSLPPTRRLAGRLRRLSAVRQLPIFVTVQQARAAVAGRVPLTEHLHLSLLPPEPASVGTAGNLVAVACDAWGLPVVTEPSRVIIRELVSNAVRHAGTDIAVTVSRRGSGIYLAVNDGDPRLPSLSEPLVRPPPGYRRNERRGLWAVHSRASAWGAMPSPNGKVVWALVRPPARLTAGGPAA